MTAPNGPILIDSTDGSASDSAASGLGPATAVSGTGGATDGTSTVDLSADTPDLSGVSSGDLLWIATTSGRQFSIIASVDDGADTVTCDDAFSTTEGSLNWGIGGVRATMLSNTDSRKLISSDIKAGWIVEMQDGHDETINISGGVRLGAAGDTTDGPVVIRGVQGWTTRPKITQQAGEDSPVMEPDTDGHTHFVDFEVVPENNIGQSPLGGQAPRCVWRRIKCVSNGTNEYENAIYRMRDGTILTECEFEGMSGDGVVAEGSNRGGFKITGCHIYNCTGDGIALEGNTYGCLIEDNVIRDNGGKGITIGTRNADAASTDIIKGNVIHSNTSDGIEFQDLNNGLGSAVIENNVITENGGYGINFSNVSATAKALDAYGVQVRNNAYRNNTSGKHNPSGLNVHDEVTLTADPYTDETNDDYTLNNNSGGGADCRDAGFPQSIPGA